MKYLNLTVVIVVTFIMCFAFGQSLINRANINELRTEVPSMVVYDTVKVVHAEEPLYATYLVAKAPTGLVIKVKSYNAYEVGDTVKCMYSSATGKPFLAKNNGESIILKKTIKQN